MVMIWVAIVLCVYLVLAWFVGTWVHLTGANLWILRGALAVIGLVGAGLFVWWHRQMRAPETPASGESDSDEMDVLVRDALYRLRSSKQSIDFAQLPIIYVLGPTGTTKTTTIVNSGLEPELLAGQVYQDANVVPTQSVNLWYTRQAMLVEAAGSLLQQPARWLRLVRKLRAGRLSSAFSRGQQAPRAAIVCLDCEAFLRPGASDAVSALARNLSARLQEVAQELGISFPVYMLFTKADRVASFADYVRNLTRDEATQVLGATLPMRTSQSGVYAEEETKRLTKAFDDLFYALAEKRLDLLARENDPQSVAGIYQFPREWRKLRSLLVQFLVDLGRPSHLHVKPFVRGFYFSGVRAVMVDDNALAGGPVAAAPQDAGGGATRMFTVAQVQAAAQAPAPVRVGTQKKAPQWIFLTQLFNEVILKDRAAMGASEFSTKVSLMRRVLLIAAAAICLLLAVVFTISFFGNRGLESEAATAAQALREVRLSPGQLPGLDDLKRLDAMRATLDRLEGYQRNGVPLRLRFGLYSGDAVYTNLRRLYFARFHTVMFGAAQQNLIASLQKLPPAPNPNDDYRAAYDVLKAYLITTSNPDKSTAAFLTPVLMRQWLGGMELDPERMAVARAQFDFYARELPNSNPYSSANDSALVERTRGYLSRFAAIERIYRSMLDEVNHKNPPIQFNRQFPGSAEAVIDSKEVEGAFTKNGFAAMQDAIGHSDRFFAGEEWVLGKQNYSAFDRGALEQELRTRYRNDFRSQWQAFLRAASVLHFAGPADASKKLSALSGNQSPLLALLWLASTNTAVADPDIAGVFQPVQAVVAPGGDRYIGPSNQSYVTGLASLQASVDQLAKSPGGMNDQNAVGQVRSAVMSGMQAAKQVEQGFKPDRVTQIDSTTAALLEAPLKGAGGILKAPGLDGGAVRALCSRFAQIAGKFPFNAHSKVPASMAEVNALFQPGSGALAMFYEQQMKTLVIKQGSEFVVNPASGAKISPAFMAFFNRAMAFSSTVYPDGSSVLLRFTLKPNPVVGIDALTFDLNGQTLTTAGAPKQFVWTGGDNGQVRVTGKLGGTEVGILNYSGTWALFQFFSEADRWQTSGNTHVVEWVPKSGLSGQPMMIGGKPLTLRYDLELAGAPVFNKEFLAGLHCSAN